MVSFFLLVVGVSAFDFSTQLNPTNIFTQWAITFGDVNENNLSDISPTNDGGFIATAWVKDSNDDFWNTWIFKLDVDGSIIWQQKFDSSSAEYNLAAVQQISDGGYIAAGSRWTEVSSTFDCNGWIVKFNNNGSIAWQKKIGGSDFDVFTAIKETKDGGFIAVGETAIFDGSGDIWVVKLSNNGIIEWQKTYGGTDFDAGIEIAETSDNGYIIAGVTESFGAGRVDTWVIKLTDSGTITWQKTYGGSQDDWVSTVSETSNGGYIVGGVFETSDLRELGWILMLNSDGTINWQKTYGGTDDGKDDGIQSIVEAGNGEFLVAGHTESFGAGRSDAWLFKIDRAGKVLWEKTYGGSSSDYGRVVESTVGNILFAGKTKSYGEGSFDLWISKLSNLGEIAGCGAMGNSSMTVTNTVIFAADTAVTAQDSSASPLVTTDALTSLSLQGQQVCWNEIEPQKIYLPLILDQ